MMELKRIDSKGRFVAATTLFDANTVQIFCKRTGSYVATIPANAIDTYEYQPKQQEPPPPPPVQNDNDNQLNLF